MDPKTNVTSQGSDLRSGRIRVPFEPTTPKTALETQDKESQKMPFPDQETEDTIEKEWKSRDRQPYPNYADDPDPMPTRTTKEKEQEFLEKLKKYSQGIF